MTSPFPHYDASTQAGDPRQALSLARTALDEGYLDGVNDGPDPNEIRAYAIEQIDAVMHLLDVDEHPALALTTLGRLIAEVGDAFEGGVIVPAWKQDVASKLNDALDIVDEVINLIKDEGGEDV
jgi:hypothetical protein